MKSKTLIALASAFTALTMVLVLVVPVLASGPQSWNLDSETRLGPPPASGPDNRVVLPFGYSEMEKRNGPDDDGQTGKTVLASHSSHIWVADQPAIDNLIFGGGLAAWTIDLITDTNWWSDYLTPPVLLPPAVDIGEWDGTAFHKFTSAWQDNPPDVDPPSRPNPGDPPILILTYVIQDFNETIHKNCYLALRVTNEDSIEHTIYHSEGTQSSCLNSTGGDPGYPNPGPPVVPASSEVGIAVMVGGFVLLSVVLLRKRHMKRLS
jgi:hypothetical protein